MKPDKLGSHLSVFDLDYTLLTVNGSFCFGKYLYRKKVLSLRELVYLIFCFVQHKLFYLPVSALYSKVFHRIFIGSSMKKMRGLAEDFVQSLPNNYFEPQVIKRLEEAQKSGHMVMILSSSPQFLVEAFAKRLKVEKSEGTKLSIDEKGVMQGIAEVMEGSTKAYFIKEWANQTRFPLDNMVVYTDSFLDLPLFKIVGKGVGVNPDQHLHRYCQENGYEEIITRS